MKKTKDRSPIEVTEDGMFLTKVSAHKLFQWFSGYMQGEMETRRFWYVLNFCRSANIQTIDQLEDVLIEYEAIEEGQKELEAEQTKIEPKMKLNPTSPMDSQPENDLFEIASLK